MQAGKEAPASGQALSAPELVGGRAFDPCLGPENTAGQGIGVQIRSLGTGGDEQFIHLRPPKQAQVTLGQGSSTRSSTAPVSGSNRSTAPPPNMAIQSFPSQSMVMPSGNPSSAGMANASRPLERLLVSGSKSNTCTL